MDVTNVDANLPVGVFDGLPFDEFYDRALSVVYGYLLRLCGGDCDEAWDLTQDSWMIVLDRLAQGQTEKVTIGYLLSVARSRYLDAWRRRQRLQRKLRLVWAASRNPNRRNCQRPSYSSTCLSVPPSIEWC